MDVVDRFFSVLVHGLPHPRWLHHTLFGRRCPGHVAKAVVLTEVLTIVSLFALTRLEAIPRSIPFIHGLLLAFGLLAARIVFRLVKQDRPAGDLVPSQDQEHVIFIGATRLTALFIQILEVCSPKTKVIGVLDAGSNAGGQSISSTRVIGSPEQLEILVEEFMEHGVRTDRVLVGCPLTSMPSETLKEIEAACNRREIDLAYIPELIGVVNSIGSEVFDEVARDDVVIPVYFQVKRFVEPIIALTLLVLALPLFLLVALLVFLNLGRPLFFWQRRLGRRGQPFLIHKFRTMKPIVDNSGNSIVDQHRGSWIGDLLRRTHLDELPQLLNVIVGDMSLIGPRPLLPHDQPSRPRPSSHGQARNYGLGSGERRQKLEPHRERRSRRMVCAQGLVWTRYQNSSNDLGHCILAPCEPA